MKGAIVYIYYLFFLLIGGGQYMHATTSPKFIIAESPSFDLIKNHQVKVKKAEAGNVLIEEADTDLDEELHSENLNKGNSNKGLVANKNVLANMYLTISNQLHYKDNSKQFSFFAPYYGRYNPIYLKIGVLRI
ncbi:hypothetical protein [Flavobacterium sp. WC2509]|uniref:hypothetical protein n=1 Tax=Flavobacterium sp. WC2509 TaxID=3461406 RepID=UPI0040447C9F